MRLTCCGACPARLIRAHAVIRVPPSAASGTCRAIAVTFRPAKMRRGGGEDLRLVLLSGHALEEGEKGGSVGGERVGGQAGPGQAAVGEGEHRAGAALAERGPAGAAAGGGALGAQDA